MATEQLIAGAVSGFTSLMTTELNSLVSGNAVIGSTAVANGTNLDMFVEFSFVSGGSLTTGAGAPYIGLYLYPLNGDGSSYGDGRFGSSAAGPPPLNYYRGYMGLPASTSATITGYFAIPGTGIFQLPMPRGSWKPVFYNRAGVTLTASGNILYYRTTNRSII